ncbi:universal stress protein [Cupriavidus necator]|uniref:universal stress protein n=1 Tax=Cupriavidus necator TaxID=106590 RepID=UPI0005B32AAE|nr:universal stress protein [Cupriavidus necator]
MHFRTILVDLREDHARAARIEAAARLAAQSGGTVVGLTATGTQLEPFRGAGAEAGSYAGLAAGHLQRLTAAHEAVLKEGTRQVSAAVTTRHFVVEAEAGWALADEGRYADLILPGPPGGDAGIPAPMAGTAEYVLLHAGRPVLLIPGRACPVLPGRVAIAWNGRREAARAVADALPWLASATGVSIVVVEGGADGPDRASGVRLADWLASHGVSADLHVEPGGNPDEVLPRMAMDLHADVLVAGGYGRPRLRELVLGGTTRALLHQAALPVFLSR